ncbi:MAG: acetylxylan esterase, partial [Verrucomicrobiae bacterium]|nr:acetylxylan esterase [Verrucomicrobiae bacterium]
MRSVLGLVCVFAACGCLAEERVGPAIVRSMAFRCEGKNEALEWQKRARELLYKLMMGGSQPARTKLKPRILQRIEVVSGGYMLEETVLETLSDRQVHAWVARPVGGKGRVPAVLALHGHGGSGEQVVRGTGLYWYGRTLAAMGYVVIAPDIGQHSLQHTNWSIMGERVWDAIRCVDYLGTLPEVDTNRLAVCGLSLGGETAMYVAALDERLRVTCSSGWLTTIENMKRGHCPCWNFEGLEDHFDFADIFACVAPRTLICELGRRETAPGGFPVEIGERAFAEIRKVYRLFGEEGRLTLTVHPAGHVFDGRDLWPVLYAELGAAYPWCVSSAGDSGRDNLGVLSGELVWGTEELLRRAEVARRCFCAAIGVYEGWWRMVDTGTGLFPRGVNEPVWAPSDNAADMLPFLAITAWCLAPHRLDEVLGVIRLERELTTRWNGLPDWYAFTNRTWVYPELDTNRLVFCAAEYCKDGLLPMTEVMGRGLWTDRMVELVEAIFANAPYKTQFGQLPANDTEVNGELLQVLSRLYFMTRDRRYLEYALRIGDAYCFEVLPRSNYLPAARWDFENHRAITDRFSLNDHGNEIVGGLSELYMAVKFGAPERAEGFRESLGKMIDRLVSKALNADGLWVQVVRPSTGEVLDPSTPDTWGYTLNGVMTFCEAVKDPLGLNSVKNALQGLGQRQYLHWEGADSYADSIESALVLLNRVSDQTGWAWINAVTPLFLGKQGDDGVVEGWYGDGNYA